MNNSWFTLINSYTFMGVQSVYRKMSSLKQSRADIFIYKYSTHLSFVHKLLKFYDNGDTTTTDEQDKLFYKALRYVFVCSCMRGKPIDQIDETHGMPMSEKYSRAIDYCLKQSKCLPIINYDAFQHESIYPSSKYSKLKFRDQDEFMAPNGALIYHGYIITFLDLDFVGYDNFDTIINLDSKLFLNRYYHDSFYNRCQCHDLNKPIYYQLSYRTVPISESHHAHLFMKPNNDNERQGTVMMFRNKDFHKMLQKDVLPIVFPDESCRLNNVFKWNRYYHGGKFNSHYDTMFVNNADSECSLYTLLLYLKVVDDTEKGSVMYLGENEETTIQLKSGTIYIIPHWVKHRVEGEGFREFIKTEIIFSYKHVLCHKNYDVIADKFDIACYLMLQSVRYPELKDLVSAKFNEVNSSRFQPITPYTIINDPENELLFFSSLHSIPIEYEECANIFKTTHRSYNYASNGIYIYAQLPEDITSLADIDVNMLTILVAIMFFDVFPKKLRTMRSEVCKCEHGCSRNLCSNSKSIPSTEYFACVTADEKINILNAKLSCYPIEKINGKIISVGNVLLSKMCMDKYFFAACQNHYDSVEITKQYMHMITLNKAECEKYISFVPGTNIIRIKQKSFNNGIHISSIWKTDKQIRSDWSEGNSVNYCVLEDTFFVEL